MTEHLTTVEGTTGWTFETLKESIDQRFADNQKAVDTAMISQEKAVASALQAAKEAVIKSEISTEKRFDTVNEAMAKVSSQSADLLPRAEYIANHKALDDKIVVANDSINKSFGDKNLYATTTFVTQTVNQAIGSLEVKMEAILTPLVNYVASQKGMTQGSQIKMGQIYAALGAFATIIGIVVFFAGQISK